MNETPRLRSAFPTTPRSESRSVNANTSRPLFASSRDVPKSPPVTKPVKSSQAHKGTQDGPLIPYDVLDAPTQRFYAVAFFFALWAWRLYDAFYVSDELDSTWLFLKWLAVDAVFLVALPAFRIEWLEYSFSATVAIWLSHAIINAVLMYHIQLPIFTWLGAMIKVAYDRELAISENRVKPRDITHNSSIILGKQIIQILPEGSAILNPDKQHFCLDGTQTSVELPIQINQTSPISIELIRYDLDTDEEETIIIGAKQAKRLKIDADKGFAKLDTKSPRLLHYSVSKKGLYKLTRVVDETKLEVRRRSFDVAVVSCPKASVSVAEKNKCTGDLSSISLNIVGVPPFKVKYSKRINHHQFSSITQSVQPPEFEPEVGTGVVSDAVLDMHKPHKAWIESRHVSFDINESLQQNGSWSYHIEEVEDGLGNKATFDTDKTKKSDEEHSGSLIVHRRPTVSLAGCDSQHHLLAPAGDAVDLPVEIKPKGQMPIQDWPLKLRYSFRPETEADISPIEEMDFNVATEKSKPQISRPGRYSLDMVETQFCRGEIVEPSACTLYNPPKPDLSLEHEEVYDKCAGRPIGMTVSLDFVGTPPFKVKYTTTHRGIAQPHERVFNSMRGQIVVQEREAGEFVYQIQEIQDAVYSSVSVKNRNLILRQNIRPPAGAGFRQDNKLIKACLGSVISLPIGVQGEGPWDLDYEIVHNGKRKKATVHAEQNSFDLELPPLTDGGRYSVVLTGVQDKSKCKTQLSEERHIEIRSEQPSVSFGDLQGHRTVQTREGKAVEIPVRLRGVGPWTISFQKTDSSAPPRTTVLQHANSIITEKDSGTYELVSVRDTCPGVVDPKANKFTISWIKRPTLDVKDNTVERTASNAYRKAAVCQGYEDTLNVALAGNPPYTVKYQQRADPQKGPPSKGSKSLSVASSSFMIGMDTSRAGDYSYIFDELADAQYTHEKRHFSAVRVTQKVYPLPTAKFANPGHTYGYCKDEAVLMSDSDSENIPIILTGSPPFSMEVAITYQGAARRPEIKRISDIPSNSYSLSLARSSFELGTHTLHIRSVKDSRNCESTFETDPSNVRILVSSPPTITPLESHSDYCVGDHVSFSLSGQAPFDVFYNFQSRERKARVTTPEFKRIAELPGEMIITGVADAAMGKGTCKARKDIHKTIHPYPSIRVSRGETKVDDIHEGGEVDIRFDFTGTPPFEFTYTRSENVDPRRKSKSKKPAVLEVRHDTSDEFFKVIQATEEGTYEVISIKDRYCAYSVEAGSKLDNNGKAKLGWGGKKLLQN